MAGITARFTEKRESARGEAGFSREKLITDWKIAMKAMSITVVAATNPSFPRSSSSSFFHLYISAFRGPEFFARCSILNFPWIYVLLKSPRGLGSAYTQRTWLHSGQAI